MENNIVFSQGIPQQVAAVILDLQYGVAFHGFAVYLQEVHEDIDYLQIMVCEPHCELKPNKLARIFGGRYNRDPIRIIGHVKFEYTSSSLGRQYVCRVCMYGSVNSSAMFKIADAIAGVVNIPTKFEDIDAFEILESLRPCYCD